MNFRCNDAYCRKVIRSKAVRRSRDLFNFESFRLLTKSITNSYKQIIALVIVKWIHFFCHSECRCECDAKVLSRREKLKKFTYQITVQDPRKSIARPLAVRQERSILIVQVRADDNNGRFESTVLYT